MILALLLLLADPLLPGTVAAPAGPCDRPMTDVRRLDCWLVESEGREAKARAATAKCEADIAAAKDTQAVVEAQPTGWPTWTLAASAVVGLVLGVVLSR